MFRRGNGAASGRRSGEGFFDWKGPVQSFKVTEAAEFGAPLRYYDAEAFEGIFTAPVERVRKYLPSPDVFPVRVSSDRAAVVVGGLRYLHFAWRGPDGGYVFGTPYGEIGVLLLCTRARPAPRILPLLELSERETMHFYGYVLHLPVTTLESRMGGRALANFPKFVADMHFDERERTRSVRLEEDGRHVLTLTVRRGGVGFHDHKPMRLLTDMDGELARTVLPLRGRAAMRVTGRPAHLELGSHEVADVLRDLELSTEGMASREYESLQLILPAAEKLGEPAHRVVDYAGRDVLRGAFTITYEPGATLDVYAPQAEDVFAELVAKTGAAASTHARTSRELEPELRA